MNIPAPPETKPRDPLGQSLQDVIYLGLHRIMQHLPVGLVSACGAQVGWFIVRRYKQKALSQARLNLARLKPELSPDEIDDLKAATAQGPTVIIYLHTGNWEVTAPVMQKIGQKFGDIYEPLQNEVELRIANEMRQSFGVDLLPPGAAGARPALRRLQAGGCIAIFCDELRNDKIMAPFFDRPPHTKGNLAMAARLARRSGARIVIGYCVRKEGCAFETHFLPALQLTQQAETRPAEDDVVLADVIRLNALIEPIILTHIDQWYYADNEF